MDRYYIGVVQYLDMCFRPQCGRCLVGDQRLEPSSIRRVTVSTARTFNRAIVPDPDQ